MFVTCDACFHKGQIEPPKVGAWLRCTVCGHRRRFGVSPQRRGRCQIAGVVRFDPRAPAKRRRTYGTKFDDTLDDLFNRDSIGGEQRLRGRGN
jgi:hypothetical protein